jgi:hypothetical protein
METDIGMITAHIGLTKNSQHCAELWDGDTCIAKMYPNESGETIRVVLPELNNFRQTLIAPDLHYLDFTRSAK